MKINEQLDLELLQEIVDEKVQSASRDYISELQGHDIRKEEEQEKINKNTELLQKCQHYYNSLRDFRERFFRAYRYYRGRQWSDVIKNDEGEYITEEDYLLDKGKLPFVQNIIRQQGKTLLGLFRDNQSKPVVTTRSDDTDGTGEMLSNALQSVRYLNRAEKLNSRLFEIAMLSGMGVLKQSYQYFPNRNVEDVYREMINPARIGFNSDIEDPRLDDLRLIFEIIDAPPEEVVATFARDKKEAKQIRNWYDYTNEWDINNQGLDADKLKHLNFYIPLDTNRYRVFEIWEKRAEWRLYAHDMSDGTAGITDYTAEEIDAENERRTIMGIENNVNVPLIHYSNMYYQYWYVKYLTPFGHTLYEGETPYEHSEHPYTFFLYPMVNGEVWGLVEDIIDQQRYINRLISLMDFMIGSAAKGVLMVPEDSVPDDMSLDEIADEWSKFDGVIKVKLKKGMGKESLPQQIVSRSANVGAEELLSLQFKMIEQIFGTSGALQGHEAKSNTPASLYMQQSQNSTINSRDFMEEFRDFIQTSDRKSINLIQQFYNERRYVAAGGKSYSDETQNQFYEPEKGKYTDFDITVQYGMDSPVYRQHLEDVLMNMLNSGHINVEMFLQQSSLPFADSLLKTIQNYKQQAQQGQVSPQMQQQLMQQLAQGSQQAGNQQEVGRAQQILQSSGQSLGEKPVGQEAAGGSQGPTQPHPAQFKQNP